MSFLWDYPYIRMDVVVWYPSLHINHSLVDMDVHPPTEFKKYHETCVKHGSYSDSCDEVQIGICQEYIYIHTLMLLIYDYRQYDMIQITLSYIKSL